MIPCAKCKYAKPDKSASMWNWIAYTCTNFQSEYHLALLNVEEDGKMYERIRWPGCEHGRGGG